MDAGIILDVTRTLIGETEPYGDSAIDRERMKSLDALIYVVDELLYDIEKVSVCKDRHEGSMMSMGIKAYNMLKSWRDWLDETIEEAERREDGKTT